MRNIAKEDEEYLKTLNLLFNISKDSEAVLNELKEKYNNQLDNGDAAFGYAYFSILIISKLQGELIESTRIREILSAYNEALKKEQDFWLALFFKAKFLLSIPEVMRDEDDLVNVFKEMIVKQKEENSHPYYSVPYIMYADFEFSRGNKEFAVSLLNEIKNTIILDETGFEYLNQYFYFPFKDFYKRLVRSNETEIANQVLEYIRIFFPKEKLAA